VTASETPRDFAPVLGRSQPTRIAIVEDSPEMADLLGDIFVESGCDATIFMGREISIGRLAEAAPDVVILDLVLSDADLTGWDLLRSIRTRPELDRVPVLICSADLRALRARHAELRRDERVEVLHKPFRLAELERVVSGLVAAQRVPSWDEDRDLVLVADEASNFTDGSSAVLRLLGLTMAELRQRQVADIVERGRDWTDPEWERYLADGRWEGPVTLRTATEGSIPAHARAEIFAAGPRTWHLSYLSLEEGTGD
jgi:CheY-like chemotaxis protein